MSHRDKDCRSGFRTGAQEIAVVIRGLLSEVDWKGLQFRGDCGWTVRGLATAALLWAWSSKTTLKERFLQSLRVGRQIETGSLPEQTSYQAFTKLLVRWTSELRGCLVSAFQVLMENRFPEQFRLAGYVVFAADGSRILTARTRSNEQVYSAPKRGRKGKKRCTADRRHRRPRSVSARLQRAKDKKADSPQMALTLLYHVMLRLPWDWRLGPSHASEREHLRVLIPGLPPDALVTADCGFFGYEFWSELLASGRQFVIRAGGNVRLLRKLGVVRESRGTIYVWPDKMARRGQAPLVLRLVVAHDGRQPWYLVTSVRDERRLSDRQVAQIYKRRWRIEVFFRNFKRTFGRAKLRSHKAEHADCETEWSLLGLWAMLLEAQIRQRAQDRETRCLSVARVLQAFGQTIDESRCVPEPGESLCERLRAAVVDPYRRRNKRSRNYPCKKYESLPKPPRITNATRSQRTQAQQQTPRPATKGLTA